MIRLRLKVQRASALGFQEPGQVIEVSEEEALRMIEAGQAESIELETAAIDPACRKAVIESPKRKHDGSFKARGRNSGI